MGMGLSSSTLDVRLVGGRTIFRGLMLGAELGRSFLLRRGSLEEAPPLSSRNSGFSDMGDSMGKRRRGIP